MWKRLRVGIARLLTRGTECTVVRTSTVIKLKNAALALEDYVNRSGALQDSGRIQAWRRVAGLVTEIRNQALDSEVAA